MDVAKIEVDAFSDFQVLKIVQEMSKRGMSENEAAALAKARGIPQNQIDKLLQRMRDLKTQSTDQINDMQMQMGALGGDDSEFSFLGGDLYSTKEKLDSSKIDTRIFGFQFFNNENLTFEPNINIPISSKYVLGAGDEILIDIWGKSEKSYKITVERNGTINVTSVGPINITGLTLEDARKKIIQRLSSIYSDLNSSSPQTFASVNLGIVKAINVHVIGEVFLPGTYTLPGTASAFNALYLSGGPNKTGSFRDIQVIRDGVVIDHLDVYEYLIKGKSTMNVALRDDDVILVPTFINRVKVGGQFKRDGLFEAKDGETVKDIIEFAGGFKEDAYTSRLELYRNTTSQKQFKDVTIDSFADFKLLNGDSIYAGEIIKRYENRISISGAVFRPGNYELTEGLTLKELISLAEGVREDAFMKRGLITRLNDDLSLQNVSFDVAEVLSGKKDIVLKREDAVFVQSIDDLRENRFVNILGEVKMGGEYTYRDSMTLSDLIFLAGGFKESATEASIEISRRLSYDEANKFNTQIAHVFQISVSRDLSLEADDAKFLLKPFDQIFIRRAPSYTEWGVVKVLGEVKYAGDYSLTSKNEKISDLIKRTGGFSPDAYPDGAMLTRKVEVSNKVKRLRQELMQRDKTLKFSDLEFDVVGVNLKQIMEKPGSKEDIFLRAGDELVIPRGMQTVKVSGEVLNPLSVSHVKGVRMKKYIDQGGGFGVEAKKNRTYVIYANGVASSTKNFLFFKKYPKVTAGSEIVVPKKVEKPGIGAAGWVGISSSFISALTLIVVATINN
ncbi:MAG: SLBB domain-containing protein [Marinilabiliaceae bacterium]|nr:SLBB domain-containing protein [Marinilabiliaceae bacterium]